MKIYVAEEYAVLYANVYHILHEKLGRLLARSTLVGIANKIVFELKDFRTQEEKYAGRTINKAFAELAE